MTKKATDCSEKQTTKGRVKIDMELVADSIRRQNTFCKRKGGIIKKGQELNKLTGAQMMLVIVSDTNNVYHYVTKKFESMLDMRRIQECISGEDNSTAKGALPTSSTKLAGDAFVTDSNNDNDLGENSSLNSDQVCVSRESTLSGKKRKVKSSLKKKKVVKSR
jgi:hypothetical protein